MRLEGGGMVIVPSDACFHQHFNSGATPARYLALRGGGARFGARSGVGGADVSIKQGGWQVEYEDEDPKIHQIFEEEVAQPRRHLPHEGLHPVLHRRGRADADQPAGLAAQSKSTYVTDARSA